MSKNKELENYKKTSDYNDVYSPEQEKQIASLAILNLLKKEDNLMRLYYTAKTLKPILEPITISEDDYMILMEWTKKIKKATYKEMVDYLRAYLVKYPNTFFDHPITRNKIIRFIASNYETQSLIRGYKTKVNKNTYKKYYEPESDNLPLDLFIRKELEGLK